MIHQTVRNAAGTIHAAICEDSFEECADEWGRCFKAAVALHHEDQLKEPTNG